MTDHSRDLRFFAFLFIGSLLFLALVLTGCTGSQDLPVVETDPSAQAQPQDREPDQTLASDETETRYKVETIRLPDSLDSAARIAVYDGSLYLVGGDEIPTLYAKDLPDGTWRQIDLALPSPEDLPAEPDAGEDPSPEAEMESFTFTGISGLAASKAGVFVLTSTYTEKGSETRLSVYDGADGTLLSSTCLEGDPYISSIIATDAGAALFGYGRGFFYSAQGELLSSVDCTDDILSSALVEGELYVFTRPTVDYEAMALGAAVDETVTLCRLDVSSGNLEPLCAVPDYNPYGSVSYTSESGLFLADSDRLSTLDPQTGEAAPIADWLDSGLNLFWGLNGLCVDKEGDIFLLFAGELYKLTPYEGQLRQELTIAVGGGASGIYLSDAVSRFNQRSETYIARLKSVSLEEMEKLLVEIASGKGPDVLCIGSSVDRENSFNRISVGSSLCEDLIPYLEADPDLSLDSFLPGVLETRMRDGHLYSLDPGVQLMTMIVPASQAEEDWSIDRLLEMNGELADGLKLFDLYNSSSLLEYFCQLSSVEYIDWATGTCRFDTAPSFAHWLELCKFYVQKDTAREREAEALGMYLWELPEDSPVLLLGSEHGGQAGAGRTLFGEDVAYVGMPGEGENVQLLRGLDTIMMLASSQNKDAAWEFLRILLSWEVQTGTVTGFMCPVTNEAFDKWVQMRIDSEWYDFTQTDGERIKAAIAQAKGTVSGSTVTDIILEEAQKYFDGQRTLEDTVNAIQSKAKLFVAEQMW